MPQVFPEIQLVLWYENSVKVETKNSLIEYGTNGVIGRSRTNLVNDVRKTFSLQGVLRDRNEINDFLLSNRGKPFVFRPYNDDYCGLFVCSNWSWRWTALNVWEFSATFSEVFRPGWIPTVIPYRMEAGSESSADLILEVPSIYLLYNGSQSGAFLGLVDPYSLNTGVESSGNLRLENGILEPYTLFTGNENGASLITGEVVVQTYVLIAGDESGAVVVTPGYFLLFSGSESGSVLSLGEGTTSPYELNTGVESSANIVLGEPSGVVYYLNGGNESSAVVSVLTDLVFDLNTGNESSANLELGEGFVPDPFYSNVSLLLFGNGTDGSTTFVDSGPANRTVTISSGTPIITTSQFKYGNGSITGGRIETPYDAAFDWGTGDFTIEFWFRYSGTLASEFRFCTGKTGNFFAFGSRLFSGRRIGVVLENVSWDVELSWTPVGVDTWAHIALTRQGTTMRIFQNGVSLGSASNSRNWNINNSPFLVMPDTNIASGGAWFDDFRGTKGVARYTDTFTPPTGQLPTQ
jgi:phage-related protein